MTCQWQLDVIIFLCSIKGKEILSTYPMSEEGDKQKKGSCKVKYNNFDPHFPRYQLSGGSRGNPHMHKIHSHCQADLVCCNGPVSKYPDIGKAPCQHHLRHPAPGANATSSTPPVRLSSAPADFNGIRPALIQFISAA